MRFAKYHGTGNDFVLVEDLKGEVSLSPETITAVCERGAGVGADGLIRIVGGERADFFMDYYNADGGTAEMCGNGIRCLAKYVFDRGLTAARELQIETRAGIKHLVIHVEDGVARTVTVDMGPPALERKAIPMRGDPADTFVGRTLSVEGRSYTATALSMGNPHCVLFLGQEDPAHLDVGRFGPMVERHPDFPQRTNVEFVKVLDGSILTRVWERGSGETRACGTGACAALVASSLAGLSAREADVRFPGGMLRVRWAQDGRVLLSGPAVCVFDGELDEGWLAEAGRDGRPW